MFTEEVVNHKMKSFFNFIGWGKKLHSVRRRTGNHFKPMIATKTGKSDVGIGLPEESGTNLTLFSTGSEEINQQDRLFYVFPYRYFRISKRKSNLTRNLFVLDFGQVQCISFDT